MSAKQAVSIYHGDCLEVLQKLEAGGVDAVITDPPYGLSFMGKKWDYDVPAVEVWAECLRVLKPGGHLLAFAGTRTQHRMAARIEDAGFEIRDVIAWIYGSGFPKSRNLKGEFEGWGTALKPALEPITVARKPLDGTVAENVHQHGTGALNIDECRVGTESRRWPANVIHDGSDEVLAQFPTAPGQLAKASTNNTKRAGQNVYGVMAKGSSAADPRSDSGSAARFFYCAKAKKTDRGNDNDHPTVKPVALMQYLCRLVTPPGGVVLDPFMGSGSTGKAARLEGFRFIGIEREAEYVAISRARIESRRDLFSDEETTR